MAKAFIIDYMTGLTGFVLDESVLARIASERGVEDVESKEGLTERDRDLLLADILFTILLSPSTIPSYQHQHGQFSESVGQQVVKDRDFLFRWMLWLYRKWDDPKALMALEMSQFEWHY